MSASRKTRDRPRRITTTALPGTALAATVIVAAVVVAYLPVLDAGYIWDDDDYVLQNPVLRDLDGLRRIWFEPTSLPQYYPLVHTSFWTEHRFFGLDPAAYHTTNVLLHALAAVLLFLLLRRLLPSAALLSAAVFALHPVQVESVAWITERKNVLSGVFYLLAFLSWLRWRPLNPDDSGEAEHGPPLYYWLALAAFVGALLSKTVTCSLPAAILLVIWWKRGRLAGRDVTSTLPFFALGAALAAVTAILERHHVGAAGADWDFTPIERVLIAGRALWFYVGKLVWPTDLSFNYPRWDIDGRLWWQYLFPAAAVAAAAVLFLLRRRIGRGPLAAVLFFGGTLLPALGFFDVYPMVYSFVADHFQYLACIGLIVLGVAVLRGWGDSGLARLGIGRADSRRRVLIAAGIALCVVLGFLTRAQTGIYQNTETLWTDTLEKNPDSWLAAVNLGGTRLDQAMMLEARGNAAEAQVFYREARRLSEKALSIREPNAYAHNNLGMILLQAGETDAAREHLEEAIRQRPDYAEPYNNLGVLLWHRGDLDSAAAAMEKAIALEPDYLDAQRNLGLLSVAAGRHERAIELLEQVLALQPGDVKVRLQLAGQLMVTGKPEEALEHFRTALRQRPDLEAAQRGVAAAEAALRSGNEAAPPSR